LIGWDQLPSTVIPSKAGNQLSTGEKVRSGVPAFAEMTTKSSFLLTVPFSRTSCSLADRALVNIEESTNADDPQA
jgi:hypothetical protein